MYCRLQYIIPSAIRSHHSLSPAFLISRIRELRCSRPYLDSRTASTIAASIVHSKLDYCNSLLQSSHKSQINRLQQV